jgi:transcriptional regulator of heat shock response
MEKVIDGITLSAVRLDDRSVMVSLVSDNGSAKVDVFRAKRGTINSEGRDTDKIVLARMIERAAATKRETIKRIVDRNEARSAQKVANVDALTALGIKVVS